MKKQRLTVVVETSSIFYVYILYKVKKKENIYFYRSKGTKSRAEALYLL